MAITVQFIATAVFGLIAATLFTRSIARRLTTVVENTQRLEEGSPLHARLEGNDEVAVLDARFHAMAEALAASRRQLESSNAQLESFSYSVSHDLRAPLRAVGGYAQMIEEDYGDRLDSEGRRFLSVIRNEARRMGTLIDDLLAFSRLGRSTVHIDPRLDLGPLATSIVNELRRTSAEPIEFRLGVLPPVQGDTAMLRQALMNLLSNAVKFSRGRGQTIIEMEGRREDAWVEISIRDYGAGFDPRHSGNLFGVFQRLHADTEFEGTGVGLAIVKRVIERHGGTVRAEGWPEEGAQFTFTLPAGEGV